MVDVRYDCRIDAGGRDPDSHSPTLREFHRLLWSKRLPNGRFFDLDTSGPKPFLVHRSDLGEFHLTSDRISHCYHSRKQLWPLVDSLPGELNGYVTADSWQIAECIVFPGRKVGGRRTINGARGLEGRIGDRFDLTLECIRRFYIHEPSPLSADIERYSAFFSLFTCFCGYVEFFLLQDLVDEKCTNVRFFLPFNDFFESPIPRDLDSYASLVRAATTFASGRAHRMQMWCKENCLTDQ